MTADEHEDNRTVIRPLAASPAAQVSAVHADDGHALPLGTRLDEFEITQRLGEGGFSIVYLAWDHSLERQVAVKEYLPMSIAGRAADRVVRPRSERHRETFQVGLKSFINEAKLLAQFDHPALVKVYRFWEANGTAYMVMPFYEGVTLRDAVRALPQPPDEAWLLGLLGPLTQALFVLHAQQCFHRDIAPDNIILLADGGRPLLLDFGAARRVIGDMTQALTVILKPGYAPVEQYDENPGMKQGPWTDVYALAAALHWAITGKTPAPSVGRMMHDTYTPLAQTKTVTARYSLPFLQAIDRALAVMPQQRTPSIELFKDELGVQWADLDVDDHGTVAGAWRTGAETGAQTGAKAARPRTGTGTVGVGKAASLAIPNPAAAPTERSPALANKPRQTLRLALITLVAVLTVASAGVWWTKSQTPPAANASVAREAVPNPPPAPTPAPTSTPTPTGGNETAEPGNASPPASRQTVPDLSPVTPPSATPAPPPAAATAPVELPTADAKPAPRKTNPKPERRAVDDANKAECARLLQRLSLGENSTDVLDRMQQLSCR